MLKRKYTLPYKVLFVVFSVFLTLAAFIPSLTVNAVPVAPTSASLEIIKNQAVVSKAAVKSKVTLQASKVSGGSANGGYYEYMFQVKEPELQVLRKSIIITEVRPVIIPLYHPGFILSEFI
jgi:hypothetical protein